MQNYTTNITPDSLTGAIMAVEGIKKSLVLLNGPTGCKFYHSALSDGQYKRGLSFDPLSFPEDFYFGQPRIPSTYLDGYDYVYGAKEKLKAILPRINEENLDLVVIINSPGASLIGDDLNLLLSQNIKGIPSLAIESTGYSGSFGEGFENALIKIIDNCIEGGEIAKTEKIVNLVGISIYNKHYEGNIKEIKSLLSLVGIEVNTVFCTRTSLEEIQNFRKAECNVVLYPEYGLRLAKWMEKKHGMPYYMSEEGLPVGFSATEVFCRDICKRLGVDDSAIIEELERGRAKAYLHISRFNSLRGLPKGATFAVKAEPSLAYSFVKWLYEYLGMLPISVELEDDEENIFKEKLENLLEKNGMEDILDKKVLDARPNIILSDGNTIAQSKIDNQASCGIEIKLPKLGYIDIVEKGFFGVNGAFQILEQVLNSLKFK